MRVARASQRAVLSTASCKSSNPMWDFLDREQAPSSSILDFLVPARGNLRPLIKKASPIQLDFGFPRQGWGNGQMTAESSTEMGELQADDRILDRDWEMPSRRQNHRQGWGNCKPTTESSTGMGKCPADGRILNRDGEMASRRQNPRQG